MHSGLLDVPTAALILIGLGTTIAAAAVHPLHPFNAGGGTTVESPAALPPVQWHDNEESGGRLEGERFAMDLEVVRAEWRYLGAEAEGTEVLAFREAGRAPLNPGPLIRVPLGTRMAITVRNPLDRPLVVHGLSERWATEMDSVVVPAGETRRVSFTADVAGTFYYWGSTTGATLRDRMFEDSQLTGALIVDAPGERRVRERIMELAFIRERQGEWSLEIMAVSGGTSSTTGKGAGTVNLQWLADGRLLVVDGDGNQARWFHPGGGVPVSRPIPYCTTPAPSPGTDAVICSGGGGQSTRRIDTADANRITVLWSAAGDTTQVHGSHFQVIDGNYVVYLTNGGDLAAAPINVATGEIGRAVRLVTGLGRHEFTKTGAYTVSASGTLVYALATNRAIGQLARVSEQGIDTIPIGAAPFLRFAFNPDGRRLAAVVEGLDGEELRVYDIRTGEHEVWARHGDVRQPIWSPAGDRLLYTTWRPFGDGQSFNGTGSVFVGAPGRAGPPASITTLSGDFEAFAWLRDGRVVGVLWESFHAVALRVDAAPLRIDTLLSGVGFVQPSPDGNWIAYNPPELTTLWIEPLPRDGRRFQVATGNVEDARWLSESDIIYSVLGNQKSVQRARFVPSADPPIVDRRRWLDLPDFRETEGQSFNLSHDGRVVYVRGAAETPVHYLRVVPNWADRMKRAVDEANR